MEATFIPPEIATKSLIGEVTLEPAFRIDLTLCERRLETTPRGARIHQRVTGGTISGSRLQGAVFADGGGEYGLIRSDQTAELLMRFMINAANGEWLYAHLIGYQRIDGYARLQAMFDADAQGPHAWLNECMFIATMDETADGRARTLTLFEAV